MPRYNLFRNTYPFEVSLDANIGLEMLHLIIDLSNTLPEDLDFGYPRHQLPWLTASNINHFFSFDIGGPDNQCTIWLQIPDENDAILYKLRTGVTPRDD